MNPSYINQFITHEEGHSSITILAVILFLTVLLLSASAVYRQHSIQLQKSREILESSLQYESILQEILKRLNEDPTPESHSRQDPVWQYLDNADSSWNLTLTDISSRLNINWMRTKLFEVTRLKELIVSTESPDDIMQKRRNLGFCTDLEIWQDTFGEENLERYFTLYSKANINITFEESLEEIYRIRYSDNGAANFRNSIRDGLARGTLWTDEELHPLLGLAEMDLRPLITAEPAMNVHYLDPFILQAILSYPYREDPLANPEEKTRAIVQAREQGEMTQQQLEAIIHPNENQLRVLQYLGTRTDFFRLTIESEDSDLHIFIIYREGTQWKQL